MHVDVRADTLQVRENFLAQGKCMLAWGQSLKVLDHGSLTGSSNHQAASSILLPLTGASGQVAQGRDRVLVAVLQLPQCRSPSSILAAGCHGCPSHCLVSFSRWSCTVPADSSPVLSHKRFSLIGLFPIKQ